MKRPARPLNHPANKLFRELVAAWTKENKKLGYRAMSEKTKGVMSTCYLQRLSYGLKRGYGLALAYDMLKIMGIPLAKFEKMLRKKAL